MRRISALFFTLLIIASVFTISCSCGEEGTPEETGTPSATDTSSFTEETGEGVLISSIPDSELPQMPEIETPEDLDTLIDEQAGAADGELPAILRFWKESVEVRRNGEPVETVSGMRVFPGDHIAVTEDINATIHFVDGSVSVLNGPCEVDFLISTKSMDGSEITSTIELELDSGTVLTKVGNLFSSASSHKVRTANTVAGAWGTIYQVEVTLDERTVCKVPKGRIRVAYVASNIQGQPEVFSTTLREKINNHIDIPQIDSAKRIDLLKRLNLDIEDGKALLDHLDNLITDEEHASLGIPKPTRLPFRTPSSTLEPVKTPVPTISPTRNNTGTILPNASTPKPVPTDNTRPTGTAPDATLVSDAGTTGINGSDTIARIIEAAKGVKTCKFDMYMNMEMHSDSAAMPYNVGLKMNENGVIDYANRKMHLNNNISGGLNDMDLDLNQETYVIEDTMYIKTEYTFGLGNQWMVTQSPNIWDSQYTINQQVDILRASQASISDGGYVNGIDCYKADVNPDFRQMLEAMTNQAGMNAGVSPIDSFDLTSYADMIKNFSATQWYAKSTLLPVKTKMDMSFIWDPDTFDPTGTGEMGEIGMDMNMTIDYKDYNQPVSIILPDEAIQADNNDNIFQPDSGMDMSVGDISVLPSETDNDSPLFDEWGGIVLQ